MRISPYKTARPRILARQRSLPNLYFLRSANSAPSTPRSLTCLPRTLDAYDPGPRTCSGESPFEAPPSDPAPCELQPRSSISKNVRLASTSSPPYPLFVSLLLPPIKAQFGRTMSGEYSSLPKVFKLLDYKELGDRATVCPNIWLKRSSSLQLTYIRSNPKRLQVELPPRSYLFCVKKD